MNPNNFLELARKGFRVTIGAATDFVETLQDPQQRTEKFSELTTEWNDKIRAWAEKGEVTEQEARRMVEEMLAHQASSATPATETPATQEPSPSSTASAELQELTARVAALRLELEQLRKSD